MYKEITLDRGSGTRHGLKPPLGDIGCIPHGLGSILENRCLCLYNKHSRYTVKAIHTGDNIILNVLLLLRNEIA